MESLRLSAVNALNLNARMNSILNHEETESGAITADDLGNLFLP